MLPVDEYSDVQQEAPWKTVEMVRQTTNTQTKVSLNIFLLHFKLNRIQLGLRKESSSLETSKFATERDLTWCSRESIFRWRVRRKLASLGERVRESRVWLSHCSESLKLPREKLLLMTLMFRKLVCIRCEPVSLSSHKIPCFSAARWEWTSIHSIHILMTLFGQP